MKGWRGDQNIQSPLHPFTHSSPSSSNSSIFKSGRLDRLRVEYIAPVNEDFRVHHLADLIEIEVAELFPLSDDDDGVTIFGESHRVGGVLDIEFGTLTAAGLVGDRVVGLHASAFLDQVERDLYGRG